MSVVGGRDLSHMSIYDEASIICCKFTTVYVKNKHFIRPLIYCHNVSLQT